MSRTCWWSSLKKPGLRISPCALTSLMMVNQVTDFLHHLWHLLALSTIRVPMFLMRRSPHGGCASKNCRHTRTLNELRCASSVVPWIALLGRKVLAVPTASSVPERMFSSDGNIMTKKRVRLSCDHIEERMYLHEVWPKVREWTVIKKSRLGRGYMSPTHTNIHTHTQKTLWVVFPVSLLWQTINT